VEEDVFDCSFAKGICAVRMAVARASRVYSASGDVEYALGNRQEAMYTGDSDSRSEDALFR
jgi:hypothetical protein